MELTASGATPAGGMTGPAAARATRPPPRDEHRHPAPASGGWYESFTWELQPADPQPAATVRLVLGARSAWYVAAVVVPGEALTVVTDLEVAVPASPSSLEVRASGLWADHNVESPFGHVSVGLEAFGVALDDPADALTDGYGRRTPVGFDLEWEDDRAPVTGLGAEGADRYEAPGRSHGEILVGAAAYEVDGPGQREHAWGGLDWWGAGWWRVSIRWDDGRHTVARGSGLPAAPAGVAGSVSAPGRAVTVTADRTVTGDRAAIDVHRDDWGLPVAARLRLAGGTAQVEPVVCVPVPLPGGAGHGSAIVSALVDCAGPGGGSGRGWLELVGPLPAPGPPLP